MKIIVVGSGGRLGGALVRLLGKTHDVRGLARADLDLADGRAIGEVLGRAEFDVLLSPAAITNVDYCEANPDEADTVNARAPELMARVCSGKGARMIHFGTDYVFDGRDPAPRVETDPVNPLGAYGRSKAAGDGAVLAVSDKFLVARVSWVFGPDRPSFLDSIIRRAMESEEVAAIDDKYSTPSYSHDLAEMIATLLGRPDISGLLNLCNSGSCSWREYGQVGVDAAVAAGLPLRAKEVRAMSLAEMDFVAPRPQYSAMSVERFACLTGERPRAWQDAVQAYVQQFARSISMG